jgi:hypothetical protein
VDSEVHNSIFIIYFCFFTIVIVLSKLILFFFKLRAAELLPFARLVEGDRLQAEVPRAGRLTRFSYDAPLTAAFMDRWRPETHTFHFPVGEMTLSLEDAAMLGGLPCERTL